MILHIFTVVFDDHYFEIEIEIKCRVNIGDEFGLEDLMRYESEFDKYCKENGIINKFGFGELPIRNWKYIAEKVYMGLPEPEAEGEVLQIWIDGSVYDEHGVKRGNSYQTEGAEKLEAASDHLLDAAPYMVQGEKDARKI